MLNTRGVNFERFLAAMAAVDVDALRWYEPIPQLFKFLAAPGCSWLLLAAPGCSWLLLAGPTDFGVELCSLPVWAYRLQG